MREIVPIHSPNKAPHSCIYSLLLCLSTCIFPIDTVLPLLHSPSGKEMQTVASFTL